MRTLWLVLAVAALSSAGCKKSETTCAQVVDNMLVVTKDTIARSGGAPNKKGLIGECERRNLTPKQKTCMAKASDLEELAMCTGMKAQKPRDRSGYEQEPTPGPQMTDDPHALPLGHPSVMKPAAGSGSGQ